MHRFSSLGKLQLYIPCWKPGAVTILLRRKLFFSCAKPALGQHFGGEEFQMLVGDQKITLIENQPPVFLCCDNVTGLCCLLSAALCYLSTG